MNTPQIESIIFHHELSGSDDDNADFAVRLTDGRVFSFTAQTPQNILHMMNTSYTETLEWIHEGDIIVRRIDEECIRVTIEKCLQLGIERFGILQI